jgi:signal transduction histidine kinase
VSTKRRGHQSIFSFGQKIVLSYFVLFILFFLILFPFIPKTVSLIMRQDMLETANHVIRLIQQEPTMSKAISTLGDQPFGGRITLLDRSGCVLYDSHVEKLTKNGCTHSYSTYHPEVQEALKKGYGYREKYSVIFQESFAYLARAFRYQNATYVLRIAVRQASITQLKHKFEIGFLTVAVIAVLAFASMALLIINHLTRPIRTIINRLRPFQEENLEEKSQDLPHISLDTFSENDEFYRLADTINQLSDKIQEHIDHVTKERDKKDSIMQSLREGIISTNDHGEIEDINASACGFLKRSADQLKTMTVKQLDDALSSPLSQTLLSLQEQVQSTGAESIEKTLHSDQDSMLDINAVKNRAGGGVTISIQDRTTQYQVVQLGKQFIANASHELKTPITIIQGFTETLQDHPELDVKQREEITERIRHSCERMDALVKSLLTLTEIENIDFADLMESCDLASIVDNCGRILKDAYPQVVLDITVEPGEYPILAYGSLVELTIFNFFKNAAKYCEDNPHIRVRLFHRNKHLHLEIEDNGIGIPKEDLEHIFERFFTVDKARSRHLGGAGLGLSIAKTVLDKHGAQVLVSSKLGEGSTFTIIFPRADEEGGYPPSGADA